MEKEILKLKERITKLEAQLEQPTTSVEVWEPKYSISIDNYRVDARSDETEVVIQTYVATEEQAEQLAKQIRNLALLDAWATEKGYKKEWEAGTYNWYVFFDNSSRGWEHCSTYNYKRLGQVYMTEEGAKATADALNSGVLVLEVK